MGGKANQKWQIVRFLNTLRKPNQLYIEPFVGACNTFSMMDSPKLGIDIHTDLIEMWLALQSGWTPLGIVTESLYNELRYTECSALRGFVGFGCSFGGKWFGGYARGRNGKKERNYAQEAKDSIFIDKKGCLDDRTTFLNSSYEIIIGVKDCLIYCDPPYNMHTEFDFKFNSNKFWNDVRCLSVDNTVVVSEMNAPRDFKIVDTIVRKHGLYSSDKEYLYMVSEDVNP